MQIEPDFVSTTSDILSDYLSPAWNISDDTLAALPPCQPRLTPSFLRHHARREVQVVKVVYDYYTELQVKSLHIH